MPLNHDLTQAEMLQLTPLKYLKAGYRGASEKIRPELLSTYATAACAQLEATKTSPQELGTTREALRQVLPWHKEPTPAPQRMAEALEEALSVAASLLGKENNPGIVKWTTQCAGAVRTKEDIDAFLTHFNAVVRQYAVIVSIRTP
jgi:hypothetical protein